MGFGSFLLRRTANLIILLLLVALFNYFLFRVMPGNAAALFINPRFSVAEKEILRHQLGLDTTTPILDRLWIYISSLFTFNFGTSFDSGESVWTEIIIRLPATLYLLGMAAFLSILFGVTAGIFAASRRGKKSDVTLVTSSIFMGSLPTFWIGLLFILVFSWYFANSGNPILQALALPSSGIMRPTLSNYATLSSNFLAYLGDSLKHLLLPLATLTVFLFGGYTLLMRNTFLTVLSEDYILTAKAKGVPNHQILYKHAFGNAVLPLVTTAALAFGGVLSGAAITETVFQWNGLGAYIVGAVYNLDWPVLQGVFFLFAITTVMANFVADIVYAFLDPRVRL